MKMQKGLTLIGLIFVSVVVIGIAILGMQITPTVIEYFTILRNIKTISSQSPSSVAEVRKAYDLRSSIDETPSVSGADLEITKVGNDMVISFAYSKKVHVLGNVSICIDYAGNSSPRKSSSKF